MRTIMTFILGAAAGAIAGLLLAPKSGDITRKEVQDKLQAQLKDIEKNIHEQSKEWMKKYNKAIDELNKQGKKMLDDAGSKAKA